MSTETQTHPVIEQLRSQDKLTFLKQYTKAQLLEAVAEINEVQSNDAHLAIEIGSDTTKAGIYEALIAWDEMQGPDLEDEENEEAPLPQGIKRSSDFDGAVDFVWQRTDQLFTEAEKAGKPKPRRRDIVNQLVAEGTAYHTARTQYQLWHKHTRGGDYLMSAGNPRPVKKNKK